MKVTKTLVLNLLTVLVAAQISICPIACMAETSQETSTLVPVFQKGMSYSSWTTEDFATSNSDESLELLTKTNTEWIAICFSWFQSNTTSYDIHPDPVATATTESIKHAITKAHNLGLEVMLKPMIDTLEEEKTQPYEHVWRGEILPTEEWFKSYSNFINSFAEFAQENGVELFCVGCELKATTAAKEQWKNAIDGVRQRYFGPITYAADGSNFQNIEWWDYVDYAGIDAYFPLAFFNNNPTFEEITELWNNHAEEIEAWHSAINKPVIFTEIGYRSGNGTSMVPANFWSQMTVDLQEQKNCYEAAFQTLWSRNWFYGFYWWTWTTDPQEGGATDTSHTPQNKPTQDLITQWYSKKRQIVVVDQIFKSSKKSSVAQSQRIGFHVSWEHNGTDVVNARVYANGTEYVTNIDGWTFFNYTYDSVGKQIWTITSVKHSEADTYKIIVENPYIIWDDIVVKVVTNSFMPGATRISTKIQYAYDDEPISGLTTFVNGKLCAETELGTYVTDVVSWNPYQQFTIQAYAQDLLQQTKIYSIIHTANTLLYCGFAVAIAAILVMFLKRSRPSKT